MLLSLVYVSRATAPTSHADLVALRDQSIADNLTLEITGLLLHHNGTFLQDLEGPEENVRALYRRICRDRRHTEVTLVTSHLVTLRRFPRWSMAVAELGGSSAKEAEEAARDGSPGDPVDPDIPEAAFVRELLDLFDRRT